MLLTDNDNELYSQVVFYQDEWNCIRDDDDSEVRPPGWYFWDEAGYLAYGPYATEERCKLALFQYSQEL